jgi:hypothetical protein
VDRTGQIWEWNQYTVLIVKSSNSSPNNSVYEVFLLDDSNHLRRNVMVNIRQWSEYGLSWEERTDMNRIV